MVPVNSSKEPIVVVGAGVTGLTTALQLIRAGYTNITIVGRHLPSQNYADYYPEAAEYASPWAGVNWSPVSAQGSPAERWDRETFLEMKRLAAEHPESGVCTTDKTTYYRTKDRRKEDLRPWYKDFVGDYRFLPTNELPPFADYAVRFTSISLTPNVYLHWLASQCLSAGATIAQHTLDHILDGFKLHSTAPKAALVINCTGIGSRKLRGVEDTSMKPIRGQLVIVENKSGGQFGLSSFDDRDASIGESCYVINRPGDEGTALGGSSYESWTTEPSMALAERIMQRAIKICPQLVPPGAGIEALKVIRHQVGQRPYRQGGPRIEREDIVDPEMGRVTVCHSYGAASFGYQASYGMAGDVVGIVGEFFGDRRERGRG